MPKVPTTSPATGDSTSSSFIHTTNCNFVDNAGRTLLLRGVNLSGSSKAPVGQPSYILEDFWECAEDGGESFIGRPLNIDDGSADAHLARLRGWGFNMLRFPVTWEALEHEGPGQYDFEFMDYTVRVLQKCKAYGFKVYMDPHQDIWSRFSGGSGAPFWTLAACGIDPRNLTATQSAIIHCEYPLAHEANPAELPAMIWSTNYGRLLSQTVFTLFFAGRDFAPRCIIDGKNIQDWLQDHYITAFGHLADRIRDAGDLLDECVIGWDSLNEPFEGFCGWEDLSVNPKQQGSTLKKGSHPTPAQSLRLGMGQAQTVESWSFGTFGPSQDGSVTIDPKGLTIWADPSIEGSDGVHPKWGWKRDVVQWELGKCVWALHGVWDIETGYILRPDYFYFSPSTELEVDFIADYWRPHFIKFTERIRQSHPEAIMFVQPPVFAKPPEIDEGVLKGRAAYSAHYYDGLTLVTRHWNWFNADALGVLRGKYSSPVAAVKFGEGAIRKSLQEQLGMLRSDADIFGPYPYVIGEIGTPFDMDGKRSYGWTDKGKHLGDYSRQEKALDASLNGADGVNGLNYTVWTYCPDHCHDWGDGWNMEDLSLWSADDLREREEKELGLGQDVDELYDASVAGSRQVLLRKGKKGSEVITVAAAASSQLSLPSVGLDSPVTPPSGDDMSIQLAKKQPTLQDFYDDPYDFLTDGARAVRAFCRPWPHKVVGVPSDIKFEISKARFQMTVTVTSDDAPTVELGADGEKQELATEIFVPLVHFATAEILGTTFSKENGKKGELKRSGSADDARSVISGRGSRPGSRWASSIDLPNMPAADEDSMASSSSSTLGKLPKDLVDVDVKVSSGRWEVDGQTLKWWYDVPKPGEEKREYKIEIKRRGGVIKGLGRGSKRGVNAMASRNWWDKLCGGCIVM